MQNMCKTIRNTFSSKSNLQINYRLKLDFQKSGPIYRRHWVIPRHQTQQGQSIAKRGTSLLNVLVENTNLT